MIPVTEEIEGVGVSSRKREKSGEMMVEVVVRKSLSGNGEEKSQERRGNISTERERKALPERASWSKFLFLFCFVFVNTVIF
jgi:hypothetical protein